MTTLFDDLRAAEFSRLDAGGHVYLDYTGGGLYGESQIRAHSEVLLNQVLGNPHSQSPTSLASTHNVNTARERICQFFDADPQEYEVIFTLNASGALKLIGESYPWGAGSTYMMTADNHNSVNGIREFAKARGASIKYLPLNRELRAENLEALLPIVDRSKPHLFAFPAQSNFSGVKHCLDWVELAHQRGYDVLLDAAAYVPTSRLSLREIHPDFLSVSFYKMFGYPTGVGALLIRHEMLKKLHRPWFGGGTVQFVSAQQHMHLLATSGEGYEDGTVNYLSIAAIPTGLDFLERIGMDNINAHVTELTGLLLGELLKLQHSNGQPLIALYGPPNMHMRGGTLAFNLATPEGTLVEADVIEDRANAENISVRTGCFCNPGAAEFAFQYLPDDMYRCFTTLDLDQFTVQQFSTCMNDMPIGAVRASIGIATNEQDIQRLVNFLKTFIDFMPTADHIWRMPSVDGLNT
ncbi:MAG: aminotransferase class V-fold PLP-dependent enzyme [Chloroflexi bacterium]|nr:aminotransferase class V-fold PLP-dependent enzyme [Chloroflexota bacterium]MCC6891928.1 aminotransferase class V-fold PLP-dependent enzyme [Anaerolineae bacterium]